MFRYTLTHGTDTYVLTTDPKGWEEAEFGITRSPKYHGMNYSQILSLSFICGAGKEFIDNIYNNIGVDEEIQILIEESCQCFETKTSASYSSDYSDDYEKGSFTLDCDYDVIFEGILDLKEIQILEEETQVPLIEQGLNQKLISRADTKIDLFSSETLDGEVFNNIDFPYTLNLHSKALVNRGELKTLDLPDLQTADVDDSDNVLALFIALPFYVDSSEGNGFYSATDTGVSVYTGNQAAAGLMPIIYRNLTNNTQNVDIDINISGYLFMFKYVFGISYNIEFTQRLLLIKGNVPVMGLDPVYGTCEYIDLVPPTTIILNDPNPAGNYFNYNATESLTVELLPGEQIYIAIMLSDAVKTDPVHDPGEFWGLFEISDINFTENSFVRINTIDQADPSVCRAQKIFESIAKVSQGILSISDPVRSDYYGRIGATPFSADENGCGSYSALTSGWMIRQYPTTGDSKRGIEISLSELFTSLDAIDNIGVGFENSSNDGWQLRWERKNFFYQDHEIISLEHVPDIKVSVAKEYAYNDILIGFEKWQTTDINGLDEYCARSQYTLALKSIDQTLEKISPIIASPYILEQIRRKPYRSTATTDTDFDSDNFIIALNREQEYGGEPTNLETAEKDENFSIVENVLSPETSYNLRFTTSKNLLRNTGSISPIITNYDNRLIKFTFGEGNKAIVTADNVECPSFYGNQPLSGSQDIVWDDPKVEEPFFVAQYLEFKYPLTREQYLIIKDAHENPDSDVHNGYITISNEKETFKGYLIDFKYKQKSGLSTFKLIRKYD